MPSAGLSDIASALRASFSQHDALPAIELNGRTWTYAKLWSEAKSVSRRIQETAAAYQPFMVDVWGSMDPATLMTVLGAILAHAPWSVNDYTSCEGWGLSDWPIDDPRLAYALRTSGSTGSPKVVLQTAGNCLAHIDAYQHSIGVRPGDRMALLTPISFDAGLMDFLGALLTGACLHIFDPRRKHWRVLAGWAQDRQLTHVHCTPTLLELAFANSPRLRSLRVLSLGGEVARWNHLGIFRALAPEGATFVNGYGPSECTKALEWRADHSTDWRGDILPIGEPVAHVEASAEGEELVLESQLLAIGYVSGLGVRAVFEPLPSRWHTGDRVCIRDSGQMVCSGRMAPVTSGPGGDITENGKAA